jgi:hypothetical protein
MNARMTALARPCAGILPTAVDASEGEGAQFGHAVSGAMGGFALVNACR